MELLRQPKLHPLTIAGLSLSKSERGSIRFVDTTPNCPLAR